MSGILKTRARILKAPWRKTATMSAPAPTPWRRIVPPLARLDLRPRRQDHADRRRCPRRMPRPRLAGGVQRRLKFDVQRAGSDATAVHRAQHLNVTDGIEAEARPRRVEGSGPGG